MRLAPNDLTAVRPRRICRENLRLPKGNQQFSAPPRSGCLAQAPVKVPLRSHRTSLGARCCSSEQPHHRDHVDRSPRFRPTTRIPIATPRVPRGEDASGWRSVPRSRRRGRAINMATNVESNRLEEIPLLVQRSATHFAFSCLRIFIPAAVVGSNLQGLLRVSLVAAAAPIASGSSSTSSSS